MGAYESDWGHASRFEPVGGEIAVVGIGEAEHSKASGRTTHEIAAQAIERAIADAGLEPTDIDGLMYSGGMSEQFDEEAFHAHFGTRHSMFVSKQGGGMAWAGSAPYIAARAIRAGKARHVLNVFSVAWATQRSSMLGGPGAFHAAEPFKFNLELPFGWFPQPVYFATIARRHMHEFGTTPEQLGAIAVACRRHANLTPSAIMRSKTLTLEDYLSRPMLVDPLRVEDCCLISDGGAAYVMSSLERARDLAQPPIVVAGVGEGYSDSGTHWSQQRAFTSTPQVFSAPPAFAMAGLEPKDVDVLTLYDPFTIVALMQIEDMGFCKKGEAGAFVEGRTLHHDGGVLPYNTHGGLLSHAYVLGIAHVVEVVRQLRGQAAAQVPGARVGVYGGYTGHMATTLILRRL
ncbi:MAG: thiolase family protein [Deltaproteobacteria bacterium]|nr:thiolase family protein [Deltaproteobacteria bacterium]MCZ6715339.1 thiolase family protein [Deltaproteobacteria bacterium]